MSDITAQVAIQRVTDTLYAPFRYSGAGIPEGVQVSEPGWIYRDTNNGLLWFKKTGSAATGWKAMTGTLFSSAATVGNATTAEATLQSNTIYGGTLAEDGDSIFCQYSGQLLIGEVLRVRLAFNGNYLVSKAGIVPAATMYYTVESRIIRVSSTSVRCVSKLFLSIEGSAAVTTTTDVQTLTSQTLSSNLILALFGTSTVGTANSVTKLTGWGKLDPAP